MLPFAELIKSILVWRFMLGAFKAEGISTGYLNREEACDDVVETCLKAQIPLLGMTLENIAVQT